MTRDGRLCSPGWWRIGGVSGRDWHRLARGRPQNIENLSREHSAFNQGVLGSIPRRLTIQSASWPHIRDPGEVTATTQQPGVLRIAGALPREATPTTLTTLTTERETHPLTMLFAAAPRLGQGEFVRLADRHLALATAHAETAQGNRRSTAGTRSWLVGDLARGRGGIRAVSPRAASLNGARLFCAC